MKRQIYILILMAVIGSVLNFGCGFTKKSPSEAVTAAYMAANKSDYSESEKYISSGTLNFIKETGDSSDSMKAQWDKATRNGAIEKIEIVNEEIRGERAMVVFKIHFKDGSTKDDKETLIRENGEWKISLA